MTPFPYYSQQFGAGFFPNNTGGPSSPVTGFVSPNSGAVYGNMPSYYLSEGGYGGDGGPIGQPIPNSVIDEMTELAEGLGGTGSDQFNQIGQDAFNTLMGMDPMGDFQSAYGTAYADAEAQLSEGRGNLQAAQAEGRRRTDRAISQTEARGDRDIAAVEGRIDASIDRMEEAVNNYTDNNAMTVAAMGEGIMRSAVNSSMQMEQDMINQGIPPAQAKAMAQQNKSQAGSQIYTQAANLYNKRDEVLASMETRAADMMMKGANLSASTRAGVMGNLTALRQAQISQDTTFAGQVASFESSALNSMNGLRQAGLYGTNQANQIKANLTKYAYDFQMQAQQLGLNHQLKAQGMAMQGFNSVANLHMTNYYS